MAPELYIACGISGSIQHMAERRVEASWPSTASRAEIFKVADYGIVADLFEAVPLLAEELKAALEA
ncbi:MAG: FAD-binding protein [Eggerthellaceae bacterium]